MLIYLCFIKCLLLWPNTILSSLHEQVGSILPQILWDKCFKYLDFTDTETKAQKCYITVTKKYERERAFIWGQSREIQEDGEDERRCSPQAANRDEATWYGRHVSSSHLSWLSGGLWSRSEELRDNTKEGSWEEQAKWRSIRQDIWLGRAWIYKYTLEEKVRSGASGMRPKSWALLSGEEGSLEHTEGTDLTCRGDLFCILLKIW